MTLWICVVSRFPPGCPPGQTHQESRERACLIRHRETMRTRRVAGRAVGTPEAPASVKGWSAAQAREAGGARGREATPCGWPQRELLEFNHPGPQTEGAPLTPPETHARTQGPSVEEREQAPVKCPLWATVLSPQSTWGQCLVAALLY